MLWERKIPVRLQFTLAAWCQICLNRSNLCQKIISKNKIFRTSVSIFLYFKRLSNGLKTLRCSNIESCHQLKLSHELTIRYGDFTGKPIHFIYLGIQVYSSHWLVTAFCYLLWHSSKDYLMYTLVYSGIGTQGFGGRANCQMKSDIQYRTFSEAPIQSCLVMQ